jgi:hypothetical protein
MHRTVAALAALLAALVLAGCGGSDTTPEPRDEAQTAARAYLDALADGDLDRACERVVSHDDDQRAAEDLTMQLAGSVTGSAVLDAAGPCPQALRVFANDESLGDLRFEKLTARASGADYWIGTDSDVSLAHALLMRRYDHGWKVVAFG